MKKISFNNLINSDRKLLYVILSVVLISIFSLTIVYAALSVTLNINGNAEVVASTWDVHLDNVQVTSGSVSGTTPSITSPTTATFSTTLNNPGEFYEFTIDVVNDGSIDAMIDSITKTPTLTETQAKYLNYIVEYENGESISTKQLVSKSSFVRLKVRVEFRKDISASDIPTISETLNLSFTVNYLQSDGSSESVANNGIYDPYKIGTIVKIGTEQFYIIGTEGDNVKLLSMYNLYIGSEYNNGTLTAYGDEATGMQDSTMLGYAPGESMRKGVTEFSPTSTEYSSSLVKEYVNNYKTKLEEFGIIVEEARLITKAELTDSNTFACELYVACSNKYPWIYSTSYWTGSNGTGTNILYVTRNNVFGQKGFSNEFDLGVRPVIVIAKSQF